MKFLFGLLALFLSALFVQSAPGIPQTYTVKSGDDLSHIAKVLCGDDKLWVLIYRQNKQIIANPDYIYIGQNFTVTCPELVHGEDFYITDLNF